MRDPASLKYGFGKIRRDPRVPLPAALLLWFAAAAVCWFAILMLVDWL